MNYGVQRLCAATDKPNAKSLSAFIEQVACVFAEHADQSAEREIENDYEMVPIPSR